ncbi:MAG: EAL domain-containing protein [Ilumatobacteraceae bacterium]
MQATNGPDLATSRVGAALLQYLRFETAAVWSLGPSPIGIPFGVISADGTLLGYLCMVTEENVGRYRRLGAAVAQALAPLVEAEQKTFGETTQQNDHAPGIDPPDGRMTAYFQPIVVLRTGEVVAVEALARVQTPDGVLSPDSFLDSYRTGPAMLGMFDRILESALSFLSEQHHRLPDLSASINMELAAVPSHGLTDLVQRHLDSYGTPADSLTIELNERLPYRLDDDALQQLDDLSSLGVKLLLDDFPSSLRALAKLGRVPITGAKLDRRFVKQLGLGEHAVAEVRAILAQAGDLGIEIIAEGVETERQRDVLVELGCAFGQGYAFAVPQPGSSLAGVLTAPLVTGW